MPSDRALALAAQWNTEAAAIVGGETVPAGHRHTQSDIDDLVLALESRLLVARLGQPLGAAPLDANSKVPVINLPDISTTRGVFPVASQAAMLALNAQVGAVAVRSDLNGQSYILAALPASNLSNWLSQSPPGTVTSVNGQTGVVTIAAPVTSVNGLTGDVVVPAATTSTDGLLSAADKTKLDAIDQTVIGRLIWTVRSTNATLSPNENCLANSGVTQLTLPTSPSGAHEIINNTSATILINRGGTATISGVAESTGLAISAVTQVRILPGQRATFVASGSGWIAQGCERTALVFAYNGTPLASNANNPSSASDLIHFLGGTGSYTNPATNGTITAVVNSSVAGGGAASVTTDRIANPSQTAQNWYPNNVVNSWIAWQFPMNFAPNGLLIQTTGYTNSFHLRSFRIHYSNDLSASLTASTPVSTWSQGPEWTNQIQITGTAAWFFFPFSGATSDPSASIPPSRRVAIFVTGPSSDGAHYPTIAEVNWFGDYFT